MAVWIFFSLQSRLKNRPEFNIHFIDSCIQWSLVFLVCNLKILAGLRSSAVSQLNYLFRPTPKFLLRRMYYINTRIKSILVLIFKLGITIKTKLTKVGNLRVFCTQDMLLNETYFYSRLYITYTLNDCSYWNSDLEGTLNNKGMPRWIKLPQLSTTYATLADFDEFVHKIWGVFS